jgi:RNA polymerase sigma-70 factor, ECF subfamily
LTLQYFDELSCEDVTAVLGLPVNTVKSHIRRGKQRLARDLTTARDDRARTAPMPTTPARAPHAAALLAA